MKSNINLHIHSIHSDGKKTIADIIAELKMDGIKYFSITDHDKVTGNVEASRLALEYGLNFCSGIELSCCFDGELGFDHTDSCHILGFGIDINIMQAEQQKIKNEKMENLRKRSIPNIFEGIQIIKKCGGIAVWAHPFEIIRTLRSGATISYQKEDLSKECVGEIAKCMSRYGIDGIETYYQAYTKMQINFLERMADEYGLLRSCGTDYHARESDQIFFEINGVKPAITIVEKIFKESPEVPLNGGRTTKGVVKIADTVRRPHKATSDFTNKVLTSLSNNGFVNCPKFLGINYLGRDTYSYIDGFVPEEIGSTTIKQLCSFMRIVRQMHDISALFLDSTDKVLCHNDLSPCNTVFLNGEPIAIIDWDNVSVGERWEDLTYIVWLWINIGSHKRNDTSIFDQLQKALSSYGADNYLKSDFANKLLWRMDKVLLETPKTNQHFQKVKDWVEFSKLWVTKNKIRIKNLVG